MSESIPITIPYRDTEKEFEAEFMPWGYTHRFRVLIDEVEVFFEPDEEKKYRAVIAPEQEHAGRKIDPVIIRSIAEILEEVLQ